MIQIQESERGEFGNRNRASSKKLADKMVALQAIKRASRPSDHSSSHCHRLCGYGAFLMPLSESLSWLLWLQGEHGLRVMRLAGCHRLLVSTAVRRLLKCSQVFVRVSSTPADSRKRCRASTLTSYSKLPALSRRIC
jgi:hypothetical protein